MRKHGLDGMMDCVKQAFLNGCERGDEFKKMRHAIIVELNRIGYEKSEIKNMLLQWNDRCEKPLGLSEQKIQLFGYIDWVFERDCKMGCEACVDYCIGKDTCLYYIKKYKSNRNPTKDLPFDYSELKRFLEERYKRDWYMLDLILDAILWFKYQNAIGSIIYISYSKIGSIILDKYNKRPCNMDIFRKMRIFIEEGVIKIIEKGKKGTFTKKANGYIFLPWKHPKNSKKNSP